MRRAMKQGIDRKNHRKTIRPFRAAMLLCLTGILCMTSCAGGKGKFPDTFQIDLSSYEDAINDKQYAGVVVNKVYGVPEDYEPQGLRQLSNDVIYIGGSNTQRLCASAASAMEAMMAELRAEGYDTIFVTSCYRSYAYQASLFEGYVTQEMKSRKISESEARKIVATYSAQPGYSEHQTGLCADLISTEAGQNALDVRFEKCSAFSWLQANAHYFGFILRYPKDKEAITGYSYEPWHYRFVGRELATTLFEKNQTMEEYYGLVKK